MYTTTENINVFPRHEIAIFSLFLALLPGLHSTVLHRQVTSKKWLAKRLTLQYRQWKAHSAAELEETS